MATHSILALQTDTDEYFVFKGVSGGQPNYTGTLLLAYYDTYDIVVSLGLNSVFGFDFLPHPNNIEDDWYKPEPSLFSAEIVYDSEQLDFAFKISSYYGYYYLYDGSEYRWHVKSLWDGGETYNRELDYSIIEHSIEEDYMPEAVDKQKEKIQECFDNPQPADKTLRQLESLRIKRGIPEHIASAVQTAA